MFMRKKVWTPGWTPEENDIIIPVMGPSGTGKSTFINFVASNEVAKVGHDLASCTTSLLPIVIDSSQSTSLNGIGRLVLVDIPGFGDTNRDNAVILVSIALWLKTMYKNCETKLAGIIYLHDISLARMPGIEKNLNFFQKLVGVGALRSAILCTTKWSETGQEEGERRTEQLRNVYWKQMIDHGSTVHKFEDSRESAWKVVNMIIEENREKMEALQIQKEMVDARKLIPETDAGQQLGYNLNQLLKILKQAAKRDPSRRRELNAQIAVIHDQMKAMRIPVTLRVLRFLNVGVDKMLNIFTLTKPMPPPTPRFNRFLHNFLNKSALTNDTHSATIPAVGARLGAVENLILLLGETRNLKQTLLELLTAEVTPFGSGEQPTTSEVRCWSVTDRDQSRLVVEAPDFDSPGDLPRVLQKILTWLMNSCREDTQLSIIYLQHPCDPVSPPPTVTSHATPAMSLVQQSALASNTLFATFAGGQTTEEIGYAFDGSVVSFSETLEHASNMFDIALKEPLGLLSLLSKLRVILEQAENHRKPELFGVWRRMLSMQST